jgi:hypothetical protein
VFWLLEKRGNVTFVMLLHESEVEPVSIDSNPVEGPKKCDARGRRSAFILKLGAPATLGSKVLN